MLSLKTLKWTTTAVLVGAVISFSMLKQNKVNAALATSPQYLGNIIAGSVPANYANYWSQADTAIIDDDFETGTDGWVAQNTDTDPVSSTEWSAKGARSLQADITMSSGTWHYLYKTGSFDLSAATTIHATVSGANSGEYGEGLGARLYVKYGETRTGKYSDKVIFAAGESVELTLDISGIDRSAIREYGVRFSDGANSAGTTAVNVDNVYAYSTVAPTMTPTPTISGPVVSSGLPVPPGANNVPRPAGAAGNLTVVNWAGFKGAVSYTFDDANSSQINNYAKLNGLGVRLTFYLQTGKNEASNNIWAQALKDGHELGNHTQSHAQNASANDIDTATNFIKSKFGVTPYTFAAPYGNTSYVSFAGTRFLLNRGVAGGSVAPNGSSDPFNLPCYIPPSGAAAGAMTSTVSSARSAGNWQIFCIHGFTGGSDGAYQPIDINQFTSHVTAVKAFGDLWIDSAVNVGAYWRAQKLFVSLTPTSSGGNLVYKWTLPANFPSGKFLRVKVNGGTLKQNNQTLNWDSHGYYEIALDAGSLTIAP